VPFTGSHAAAVLPLARRPLVASALVIGSMAPDFPYYLPFPLRLGVRWHSLLGLVTVDLAAGLVVFVVWHALLVPPAVAVAPEPVRRRLAGAARGLSAYCAPATVALVAVSIVLGAATHVGWDAFTHEGRWGVEQVTLLRQQVGPLPGYRWAQYASTTVGGGAILLWLALWWRRAPIGPTAVPAVGRRTRLLVAAGLLVAGCLGALQGILPFVSGTWGARRAVFESTTGAGGAAVGLALALAVCWHLARLRAAPGAGPDAPPDAGPGNLPQV